MLAQQQTQARKLSTRTLVLDFLHEARLSLLTVRQIAEGTGEHPRAVRRVLEKQETFERQRIGARYFYRIRARSGDQRAER